MAKKYIKRLFDDTLEFSLKSKGAVVVEGPKWCGKSTTCKRYAKEIVDLMPLKTRDELILEAKLAPHIFLNSRSKPLLIDEWQHIYSSLLSYKAHPYTPTHSFFSKYRE